MVKYGTSMCAVPAADNVARLMAQFREGNREAANRLFELLYPELRRLAVSKMKGERTEHTWQPTVLVNELYMALVRVKSLGGIGPGGEQEKAAFLGFAGHMMKRLLIEHARPLYRRVERIELQESDIATQGPENLQEVEEALSRLGSIDPKFRTVVEMRVFEGLTGDEIAAQLGCSPRTVATYWNFAKCWLQKELGGAVQS